MDQPSEELRPNPNARVARGLLVVVQLQWDTMLSRP